MFCESDEVVMLEMGKEGTLPWRPSDQQQPKVRVKGGHKRDSAGSSQAEVRELGGSPKAGVFSFRAIGVVAVADLRKIPRRV